MEKGQGLGRVNFEFVHCVLILSCGLISDFQKLLNSLNFEVHEKVHFVFDKKHDGRHKIRLVADRHLTDIPLSSIYSGMVSL